MSEVKTSPQAHFSTVAVFQQNYDLYRKLVENNYLNHREVYGHLHRILVEKFDRPFRFLDVACGDASAGVGALLGTMVSSYHGIDFSSAALEMAREELKKLDCDVILEEGDFVELLPGRPNLADVIWIGFSLHHLRNAEKLAFMREIRADLPQGGLFLTYEHTSRDGEDRDGFMRRLDLEKPLWTTYSDDEWNAMMAHVHAADYPETVSAWHALGRDSGFTAVTEVFAAPCDLWRMFCFSN